MGEFPPPTHTVRKLAREAQDLNSMKPTMPALLTVSSVPFGVGLAASPPDRRSSPTPALNQLSDQPTAAKLSSEIRQRELGAPGV
jgi:hypothetical protein